MSSLRPIVPPALRAKLRDPRPMSINNGVCGYCTVGGAASHTYCKRGIRNGDGSIMLCMCADPVHNELLPRCTECLIQGEDHVDAKLWLCKDRFSCEGRVEGRISQHPTIRLIRQVTGDAIDRQIKEGRRKPPREKSPTARPKTGTCLCCGETTGGGKFLPGHDARLVSQTATKALQGNVPKATALEAFAALGVSEALVAKLAKRLA